MENRSLIPKRCSYSIHDMEAAIKDVKDDNLSIKEAAKKHKVPSTTLRDRLNGRHEGKYGGSTILSHAEELEMVDWIEFCGKVGQPVTKDQILNAAMKIAQLKGDDGKRFQSSGPSEKWLKGFRDRHPIISTRKPEALTSAAANVTPRNISIWFNDLIEYLKDKNIYDHLMERPQNMLNLDESGIDINAMPKKVFTTKNVKHTYKVESAKHHVRVTVTLCVAADGSIMPSQIIMPNSFSRMLDVAHAAGEEKMKYEWSQTINGWQNKQSYFAYLKAIDAHMEEKGVERPYIMFSDGYPAHHDLEIFKWCKSKGIVYVPFFPNCTQAIQPLDVSVFHSLKSQYRKDSANYKTETKKSTLDEVDFVKIFSRALRNGVTPAIIKNGFRSCGLYPLDRNQVHNERLLGGAQTSHLNSPSDELNVANPQSGEINDVEMHEVYNVDINETQMRPKSFLDKVENLMKEYQKVTEVSTMKSMIIANIQQQLNLLQQVESESEKTPSTLPVNLVSDPITLCSSSNNQSLANILEKPMPNERKRKRQLKVTKCGVMSSEKIIEEHEKFFAEKQAAEDAKEDRKRLRTQNQKIKENVLKIKKENCQNAKKSVKRTL